MRCVPLWGSGTFIKGYIQAGWQMDPQGMTNEVGKGDETSCLWRKATHEMSYPYEAEAPTWKDGMLMEKCQTRLKGSHHNVLPWYIATHLARSCAFPILWENAFLNELEDKSSVLSSVVVKSLMLIYHLPQWQYGCLDKTFTSLHCISPAQTYVLR